MDAVEILLLCVVGFSVLVFLILDNLDSFKESRRTFNEAKQSGDIYDSENKTRIGSSTGEEISHQEEEKSVGTDGKAEKQVISENFKRVGFQETVEGEETKFPVNASDEKSDICSGFPSTNGKNGDNIGKNREISDDDDDDDEEEQFLDDWEGVERTELETIFGKAMIFVSCKRNADRIDEDEKLQLYGLQKVALDGPCHGSQPMTLNISARSKWSAWHKLGNVSREMAMEKYIDILSEAIPGWKGKDTLTVQDAVTSEDLTLASHANEYGAEAER